MNRRVRFVRNLIGYILAQEVLVEHFETLKKVIAETEADLLKWKGGNKAAGVRVRKSMQDVKDLAQQIRAAILESRDAGDAKQ